MKPRRDAFEGEIEASLLDQRLREGRPAQRSTAALGLDPGELLAFVAGDPAGRVGAARPASTAARRRRAPGFLKRLAAELDERGTVDVLRHGVKDLGVDVRLAYFKPAHGLDAGARRAATTRTGSTVVRQLALRRLDERRSTSRCSSTASRSRRRS